MASEPQPSLPRPVPPAPPPRRPVRVTIDGTAAELAADVLFGAGATAVSERSLDDGRVELVADPDPDLLDGLTAHFGTALAPVDDPDPSASWQDHATVLEVGERLVVRPEWLERPALRPDQLDVVVAAADAFGSGAHATTRLCLEALEPLVLGGEEVLDVGSGSGVLAVAAALLGAAHVRCYDIEPAAVLATGRSAELSGVIDRIVVSGEPVERADDLGAGFDLVLANMLLPAIEQLGATLAGAVRPGGHLVVSGILADQRDRAVAACAPLVVQRESSRDDWIALVLVAAQ